MSENELPSLLDEMPVEWGEVAGNKFSFRVKAPDTDWRKVTPHDAEAGEQALNLIRKIHAPTDSMLRAGFVELRNSDYGDDNMSHRDELTIIKNIFAAMIKDAMVN